MTEPVQLDSITDAGASTLGAVVVSGSHGGLYPAVIASRAGAHAVVFNDAGIGMEQAGVAGVAQLAACGMAAASVDCHSARIGSARDMVENGVISFANAGALELGVREGMPVSDAVACLSLARNPSDMLAKMQEARSDVTVPGIAQSVLLVDSASLVTPEDAGRIIIAGSHGGLIGGDPARALKAKARFVCFNDAGIGKERIGVSRLPALDARGVAAVTVSHATAIIGNAASSVETGQISAANDCAAAFGIQVGDSLRDALLQVAEHPE